MTTITLTPANVEPTIAHNPIVPVDFWASWCGPCRAFGPVFDRSARLHPDIAHAKVDTEAEQELAAIIGIRSIPTIMAFRDGVLIHSQPEAMPPGMLEDLITKVQFPRHGRCSRNGAMTAQRAQEEPRCVIPLSARPAARPSVGLWPACHRNHEFSARRATMCLPRLLRRDGHITGSRPTCGQAEDHRPYRRGARPEHPGPK